jgi:hypothetical protein
LPVACGSATTAGAEAGGTDAFVGKLDPQGATVWARRIGGPGSDAGHGVAVDAAGDIYYVTGIFQRIAHFDPPRSGVFSERPLAGVEHVCLRFMSWLLRLCPTPQSRRADEPNRRNR